MNNDPPRGPVSQPEDTDPAFKNRAQRRFEKARDRAATVIFSSTPQPDKPWTRKRPRS